MNLLLLLLLLRLSDDDDSFDGLFLKVFWIVFHVLIDPFLSTPPLLCRYWYVAGIYILYIATQLLQYGFTSASSKEKLRRSEISK